MRFAPLLIAIGAATFACNALVGFGDLEKTPSGKGNGSSSGGTSIAGLFDEPGNGPCDLTQDFEAPVSLDGPINQRVGDQFIGGPTFTADELTVYFERSSRLSETATGKMFKATRKSRTEDFGEPTELTEVTQSGRDFAPALRSDGLALFFASDVDGTLRHQLMVAQRSALDQPFSAPKRFEATKSDFNYDTEPFLTAEGDELFYSSSRGIEDFNLRINRSVYRDGRWSEPEEVTELRSDRTEIRVTISHDGLTMYFGSDRRPEPENGGIGDIYVARRANKSSKFEGIRPVEKLNSSATDVPSWVSEDHCRLYITRLLPPGGPDASVPGSSVIMMAQRPPRR